VNNGLIHGDSVLIDKLIKDKHQHWRPHFKKDNWSRRVMAAPFDRQTDQGQTPTLVATC
jgi:hypothetical protein